MAKPIKIPRKLAGVKIPKVLRKGPVGDFVNSAAGQLIIAEAVTLAIGALAARRTATGERAATTLAQRVAETSPEGLRESGDRLARAFRAGLDAFRESLQSGDDDAQEPMPSGADEEEPPAKKRTAPGAKGGASAH
jgi:hypothetical protein